MIDKKRSSTQEGLMYDTLESAMVATAEEIERRLKSSPVVIRSFTEHLTLSKGKNIRAYSLLASAINKDNKITHDAVLLATAVEILHLATLVHDDVIDDSELRRGEVTLQKKYGKKSAVICGDFLFCIALQLSSEVSQKTKDMQSDLPMYMGKICLGELRQGINNRNFNLSTLEYYKIISGKTAALFEAAFVGGFALSGEDDQMRKIYKKIGHNIGMMFQLTDDCIDYAVSREKALKPVLSDYLNGVITLPIIHTFMKNADVKRRAENSQITADELALEIKKENGLEYTHSVIKKYYDKTLKAINSLNVPSTKKESMLFLLEKSIHGLTLV